MARGGFRSGAGCKPKSHCKQGHELEGNRYYNSKGESQGCAICYEGSWKNYKETPDQKKNKWLKFAYGITLKDYLALLEDQNYACAICGDSFNDMPASHINVDHCHNSNVVRGLLCRFCNNGLGHFRDSEERLKNAIKYLKR